MQRRVRQGDAQRDGGAGSNPYPQPQTPNPKPQRSNPESSANTTETELEDIALPVTMCILSLGNEATGHGFPWWAAEQIRHVSCENDQPTRLRREKGCW